jgi:hypothetical protein
MSEALPHLLSPHDVAMWLGLTHARVSKLARAGKLPSITLPDGELVFEAADLAAWIEARRQRQIGESPCPQ